MSGLQYMKGVRTRFYNKLLKEIQNVKEILNTDLSDLFDVDEYKQLRQRVLEAKLSINLYNDKLMMQSEKLSQAIDDSDIIEEASTLYHKLQIFEDTLQESKETEHNKIEKKERALSLAVVTEEMKTMFEAQMELQRVLVESKRVKKDTVKLPKIDIPSFNGNKLYWIEFWDSFENSVHKNDSLSDVDTFNYLKSKLTGDSRNAIIGLTLSNTNYSVAIEILHKRFGNRQETIDSHYKALMDMNPARNSLENLRQFIDKVEKHLRCLEVLSQDTNQDIFVSMIRRKLPNDGLLQIEIMKGAGKSGQ
ncbi:uncharacterized protein LOC132753734 [Ruditapes philippinarum]|uniref:uncharacterized protein LOC132753734 n=1 Tax=Ruditapes philippinarum TaxID=129788 RepID=UPI00295BB3BB|nr:uncharacterized protein LOC132753734 [Ruditapes philippinarum]